jgi:hypothetical protein
MSNVVMPAKMAKIRADELASGFPEANGLLGCIMFRVALFALTTFTPLPSFACHHRVISMLRQTAARRLNNATPAQSPRTSTPARVMV